ncbi:hypothetical protein GN958_ATG02946 [Phytophthora infestans]|uniref:Uncharacterized protein n=1 Tax=Phytophthora infestans TaxID=4787 RepID=A0A8S9V4I4_PHYIN|nr:hypothetical protein GN958_ATG02946 [Phytophthora infestans]
MIEFWSRLQAVLAANSHSVGLDALDRLVLRLLADNTSQTPLESAVIILPSPESMFTGQFAYTLSKPPPAKKQCTSKKAKSKPRFSFDLPTDEDATIERDLERLVKILKEQGKTPPRMAFPWKGCRLLLLELYPPTDNAAARRKLKASALQARLQLLSAFFEEMGYYGILTAFEDTVHDNLMWFGGRAAKHASGANDDFKSPTQEDLGVLLKRHRRRYDQVIANTLDPFEVDSSGYRSIPELLETSQAIDPKRSKNLRLLDKALARIALNVSGSTPRKRAGSAAATVARGRSFSRTVLFA